MLRLQPIFSDHALFLHSAPLTLRGTTNASDARAILSLNGNKVSEEAASEIKDGLFEITLSAPAASFDRYEITVISGSESIVLHDILFGELWLASGQSNMEMANASQIEHPEYIDSLKEKNLRFFWQRRNPGGHTGVYPYEPDYTMEGRWATMDDRDLIRHVSACATAFSNKLYEFLNSTDSSIPVGFVNSSVGGTLIEPWLPREAYENNAELTEYLRSMNRYPDIESWNARGEGNYQQTSCMFNQLIAPHIGAKFRGIIWYQGESNCGSEFGKRIYAKLLKALRESYKKIFAASEDEVFPILSSMIYPWSYGVDGETNIGYLNKAFSDLAIESPSEYPFIPICDLKPIWAFHLANHPIHPIHKYPLGERMALLCCNSLYGRSVKNVQKLPPMLKSCVRRGNTLRLTFSNTGSGLYIKDKKNVRGMYICGTNGVYTPAKCEILNRSTISVYAPGVEKPVHVAYAISSYEAETNLYAGEFPVAPFGTQLSDTTKPINIQLKPWLNTENDSEFICNFTEALRDVYRQPIFHASESSTVCFDTDFSLTGRSLRVRGATPAKLGAYVLAHRYNALDLYNYSALNASFMNTVGLTAKLVFHYAENNGTAITVSVSGERKEDLAGGWTNYSFDLTNLPVGKILKMEFAFSLKDNNLPYVNIDNLWLSEK
ncbi:MAG: hypothetical protein IJY04_03055 [Clostridia bacterium]|nr:hypothetical protein [Clostridia bacterium]